MTRSELRARLPDHPPRPIPETPADVIARGWIDALDQINPAVGDPGEALRAAEHWTVETLLKLGFAAPDLAYEVGLRIVELSDDPWILETVSVSVFEALLRRDGPHFEGRISADAHRLPRLGDVLDHVGLDGAALGSGLPPIRHAIG
jgi:hypothetical protein